VTSTVTTTQIANQALGILGPGSGYLTDLATDTTTAGQALNRTYELVRDEVLEAHPWNFAVARASLSADVAAPEWGFDYQFSLPANCLRFLSMYGEKVEYQIEGDKLLCDEQGPLLIRYIKRETDTSKYSPTFVSALACRWAFQISGTIESRPTPNQIWEMYLIFLAQAKGADAQSNPAEEMPDGDWLSARR
jgi:hypothetical protein